MGDEMETNLNGVPKYEPPYDNPLEDEFARNLVKYIGNVDDFDSQVPIATICGTFIVDFVVRIAGQSIGFECDGKDFHDEWRDEWRDAMILGAKAVDVIYRLRGPDLYYHMEDCLFIVSQFEPGIFSKRGLTNLISLSSDEARDYDFKESIGPVMISYKNDQFGRDPLFILIERRSQHVPVNGKVFWRTLFEFASARNGGNLDTLIAEYQKGFKAP